MINPMTINSDGHRFSPFDIQDLAKQIGSEKKDIHQLSEECLDVVQDSVD